MSCRAKSNIGTHAGEGRGRPISDESPTSLDGAGGGRWDVVESDSQILPVHAVLLHTGEVLYFAGSGNDPKKWREGERETRLWDPEGGIQPVARVGPDLFCAGHCHLDDGCVLAAGGNEFYVWHLPIFQGIPNAYVFQPEQVPDPGIGLKHWYEEQRMKGGRWYPTLVSLGDGRVVAVSGVPGKFLRLGHEPFLGATNRDLEVYLHGSGWQVAGRSHRKVDRLYPRLHLLPSGDVLCSGPQKDTLLLDPKTWKWQRIGRSHWGGRQEGTAVLLPLTPPDYTPRVIILGGSRARYGDVKSTDQVELMDLAHDPPSWEILFPLNHPRRHVNAVLLPDERVLVVGGGRSGNENAVLPCEVLDVADDVRSEKWLEVAHLNEARLYHSVAVLLSDGRVWAAGSNPRQGVYEESIEVYTPPYFKKPRPSIDAAPKVLKYGSDFIMETGDPHKVSAIALMRPGSVTHSFDVDQRYVALDFRREDDGLRVSAPPAVDASPPGPNIAPPGYYMLFLVDTERIPSKGHFVHLQNGRR